MSGAVAIFLLALLWAAMTEEFTLANLIVGFILGYLILMIADRAIGPVSLVRKFPQFLRFSLFFLIEFIRANLRVAHDVVTPRYYMRPGVIAVPLDAETNTEITSLANLITLTPGTLSLDVSSDRKVLYIYAMFIDDHDELVRHIKERLERPILELLR